MITTLFDPFPKVCDQLTDEIDVVEAVLLAASKEICAKPADGKRHTRSLSANVNINPGRRDLVCGLAD